jgi:hypothetical protein
LTISADRIEQGIACVEPLDERLGEQRWIQASGDAGQ